VSDPYLFGQPISFSFYPTKYNQDLSSSEVSAMTLVSAYVFPDTVGLITPQQGTSGAGSIQGPVASWTGPANSGYTIAFAAIDDPYPTSLIDVRVYFVTINVKLATGAQTQTIILPLILRRVAAHHSRIETTAGDLATYYPTIGSYFSSGDQDTLISVAKKEIQRELEGKFLIWLRIDRLDRLNDAVALKALANGFLSLMRAPNDRWDKLHVEYAKKYNAALAVLRLEYDENKDGIPDVEATAKPNFAFINIFDTRSSRNKEP
jgi:hypothetical protein